ncbi:GvpL/GvpF family gas vesicle protein, partial [Yangia mangrovi]
RRSTSGAASPTRWRRGGPPASTRYCAALRLSHARMCCTPPEDDVQALRAAFLLPEAGVEAFSHAAEQAASACDFAGTPPLLRLVHPTPPFNFVSFSLATEPDREVL